MGEKGIEENMDSTVTEDMQYEQWYYLSNSCKISPCKQLLKYLLS